MTFYFLCPIENCHVDTLDIFEIEIQLLEFDTCCIKLPQVNFVFMACSLSLLKTSQLGCRIHQQNLCRGGKTLPDNECPEYYIKQSEGKALVLEIWGMWSTPSLLSLPHPLWLEVVAPDQVLSMGQTVC